VKVAIVLNGISLKKKFFYKRIVPVISESFSVDVFETHSKHDAVSLASRATDKKYDVILAAGGDGTVNQVLNGVLKEREESKSLPILGVIPIGSGNDFARTLNVTPNPQELVSRLAVKKIKTVDVGKILCVGKDEKPELAYFINVADAGMGPEVVRRVMSGDRIFGAGIAYYTAILKTFASYKPMNVSIQTEGWVWKGNLRTLAVANGKYYGHGLCIAPDANIDDGIFSSFICGDASVAEFIWHSTKLRSGKKITHPNVVYGNAYHLQLASESPCLLEADGEWIGYLPATIDLIPQKIRFLC